MVALLPRRRLFLARLIIFAALTITLCLSYCGFPTCVVDSKLGSLLFGPSAERVAGNLRGKAAFERLDMTARECKAAFPDLAQEIEKAVARGPFKLKKMPDYTTGMVQGRIEDGKVSLPMCRTRHVRVAWHPQD